MTNKIFVYTEDNNPAIIKQLSVKRDWMDDTPNKHAYQCMPVSLANTLGWGISFPKDISFIWDGICDTSDSHVKILSGHRYCSPNRGNATISFNTYLTVKTDDNTTTLIMPVPNDFNENFQCFTNLLSTSFYRSSIPIAWRILKPNVEITIPAGTPVATIIPISLNSIQNFEVEIKKEKLPSFNREELLEDLEMFKNSSIAGKFTNLYKKAENSRGNKIGSHESKTIKLRTIEN